MAISVFPRSQAVRPGTPIRFAVGSPAGPRSQTWTVLSGTQTDEVFLGPEEDWPGELGDELSTGILRLSQRRNNWRLEYTQEGARRHPWARKRLISQWPVPQDSDGGWRRALSIVVPTTSLTNLLVSPDPDRYGRFDPGRGPAFWPSAPSGSVTQFDVMLGTPGHWRLTNQFAGEVGRTALAGVGAVWVVAHYPELSGQGMAELSRRHAELLDSGERPSPTWSAAVASADGSVVLFDFSAP